MTIKKSLREGRLMKKFVTNITWPKLPFTFEAYTYLVLPPDHYAYFANDDKEEQYLASIDGLINSYNYDNNFRKSVDLAISLEDFQDELRDILEHDT